MKRITIFYAGLIYDEFDDWSSVRPHDLPDGAYILSVHGETKMPFWYIVRHAGANAISLEEVPKELRTLQLLLT